MILSAMRAAAVMALLTACRRPTLQLCHPWRLSISDPDDVKKVLSSEMDLADIRLIRKVVIKERGAAVF